ncbi:MAG TPA: universal stress protein [Nitrososphaeraceae archaeon]|jgi:nucleotide-binding universal stress UspA family protein|nr:universal stress protein [Nitrososphaeraceae archaeon]
MSGLSLLCQKKIADKNISIQIKALVAIDSVATEIVHYAEQNSIDLIVMATRGKTGVKRMLLGSVALHVITYAHCPVLVTR